MRRFRSCIVLFRDLFTTECQRGDDMVIVISFTAKFSAKRAVHTVGCSELFAAEFSVKQGDDMVIEILFTAKFSAKRGVHTVGRSELFTAEFSAKRGDDMVIVILFTAKFSAK